MEKQIIEIEGIEEYSQEEYKMVNEVPIYGDEHELATDCWCSPHCFIQRGIIYLQHNMMH